MTRTTNICCWTEVKTKGISLIKLHTVKAYEGEGRGGVNWTINAIDLIFGTYSELPLDFQFSETTWCLIGFHGNHSYTE